MILLSIIKNNVIYYSLKFGNFWSPASRDRASVDKYGFFSVLSRNEISCIVDYLATM